MVKLAGRSAEEVEAIRLAFLDLQEPGSSTRGIPMGLIGDPLSRTAMAFETTPSVTLVGKNGEVTTTLIPRIRDDKPDFINTRIDASFDWARPALEQMAVEYEQIRRSDSYTTFRQFYSREGTIAITESNDGIGKASFGPDGRPVITFGGLSNYANPEWMKSRQHQADGGFLFQGSAFAHELFHTGDHQATERDSGRHANAPLFQTCLALDAATQGSNGLAMLTLDRVAGGYYSGEHHMEAIAHIGENSVANPDSNFSPLLQAYLKNVYLPDADHRNHDRKEHFAAAEEFLGRNQTTEIFGEKLGAMIRNCTQAHQTYITGWHGLAKMHRFLSEDVQKLEAYKQESPAQREDAYATQETQRLEREIAEFHTKREAIDNYFEAAAKPVREHANEINQRMQEYLATVPQQIEKGVEIHRARERMAQMDFSSPNPFHGDNTRTQMNELTRIAANGDVERFHRDVPGNFDITALTTRNDDNLLHKLAEDGNSASPEMMEVLKQQVAVTGRSWDKFINTPNRQGDTPLDTARDMGNDDFATQLEQSGGRSKQSSSAEKPCFLQQCRDLNAQLAAVPSHNPDAAGLGGNLPKLCQPIKVDRVAPSRF